MKNVSYETESKKLISYHDINGKLIRIGDKVKVVYNSGINQGMPNVSVGIITKMDDWGNWTLDGDKIVKPNDRYDFTDKDNVMHFICQEKRNGWEYTVEKI